MNKEDLLKIINTYGIMPQLKYFQSEVFELNEAIIIEEDRNKHLNLKKFSTDDIAQEIADCYVMIEQFRLYYDIPNDKIQEIMKQKINRQLDRIEKEKKGV